MNDTRIKYIIKVKQTVPLHELHRDDIEENPTGTYTRWAMSEDEALDDFHANIPIACLDDFDITCVAEVAEEVWKDIQLAQEASYMHATVHTFKMYAPEPHEYVDEMEPEDDDGPEESDMADIRNYEELDPSCKFTLDINEAMDALHEGKKLQCEEWGDEEYIRIDKREDLVDENDREMSGSVLIMNRIFEWRVIK